MLGSSATRAPKHRPPSSGSATNARMPRNPSSRALRSRRGRSAIRTAGPRASEEDRVAGGLDADGAA
eukprot:7417957-Alexandrium_andersonii.AAC.1